jgi:hypothetical protein
MISGRSCAIQNTVSHYSPVIMLVHGFTVGQLDELIRAGLATAQTESVVARSRTLEVARVRITKAGRMILTGR